MIAFNTIELHTARLLLRPFREGDEEALFAIYSDPQVSRYLPRGPWIDIASARERIAKDVAGMASGEYVRLAIVRREDGLVIGDCCLFEFNQQCRRAEIGYSQLRSEWGNGYVNEALRALVELAFTELDLNRIEADIDPRNEASGRSLERLGFVKEGHLRERWIVEGEVSDTGLYGLIRSDWKGLSA
jgi:ribosomal-protein-alanine N-acetyltransferase